MATDINDIVEVNISRENASAISGVAFGIPAIIGEFTTAKTTVVFDRYRLYSSLASMRTDGWSIYDLEYKAAASMFRQTPAPTQIMIGRKDSGDTTWTDTLDAIQLATQQWYVFSIIPTKTAIFTFSADLITGDKVDIVVNGEVVGQVAWATDMQTTMGLIKTAVEAALTGSVFTVGSTPYRTATLVITNGGTPSDISVTLSNSSPNSTTCTITMDDSDAETAYKAAAAWAEDHIKIFSMSSSEADILTASAADIATFMKSHGGGYDRTIVCYDPNSMSDINPAFLETGWTGLMLPMGPGTATWCYKQIKGVSGYSLTPVQAGYAQGKNSNIYIPVADLNVTENGVVASGEYIDVIEGIDYMKSALQVAVFAQLVAIKKVPFTEEGILLITSTIQKVLEDAAALGIIVKESIVITAPKVSDISDADKKARLLPDVKFTATLQGAIHKTKISGNVTL